MSIKPQSPLERGALRLERSQPSGLHISELPFRELTNVRGRADAPLLSSAIRNTLQITLPEKPNTVAAGPTHLALWLGPDEWLLQSREPLTPSIERVLRSLLAGEHAAVIDVSSGYAILRLSGQTARATLSKGCPLDLHPRVFTQGTCAQSHFFKAPIVLRPAGDDAYEFTVRRSFADYALSMLIDAAQD